MVAAAAFLIILVILFGLENVRSFFFGTLGVLGWFIAGFIIIGSGIIAIGKFEKMLEERKKAKAAGKKPENGDVIVLVVVAILTIGFVIFYRQNIAPKYYIIQSATINGEEKRLIEGDAYLDKLKCTDGARTLDSTGSAFKYRCAKNCKKDDSTGFVTTCEEEY